MKPSLSELRERPVEPGQFADEILAFTSQCRVVEAWLGSDELGDGAFERAFRFSPHHDAAATHEREVRPGRYLALRCDVKYAIRC